MITGVAPVTLAIRLTKDPFPGEKPGDGEGMPEHMGDRPENHTVDFDRAMMTRLIDKTSWHTDKHLPVIIGNHGFDFIVDTSGL